MIRHQSLNDNLDPINSMKDSRAFGHVTLAGALVSSARLAAVMEVSQLHILSTLYIWV